MQRDILVGLRREDKSYWERRTPLPPQTCLEMMDKHPRIQIIVQPSSKRIFTDTEYTKVGCILQEDLTKCVMIVCIKEIPLEKYIPGMTYIHWSHIIKAQPANMPALDRMLELKVRQIDYEKILDENGVNITAFPYAGIAGIITFLNEYGKWLLQREITNPFLSVGPAYQYYNLEWAYSELKRVGKLIQDIGLPKEIGLPLTIGVLGAGGKCGHGSMEALSNLPITLIQPDGLEELLKDTNNPQHRYTIYVVPFHSTDLVRLEKDHNKKFTSKEYYDNPINFVPVFHEKYLPYLSIIVNDIYWDNKFPRYITNSQMKNLVQNKNSRLQAVCDVTCDLEGSIQFLKKFTTSDNPVYFYNPINESIYDQFNPRINDLIMYMSFDFLPCQLPYDASIHFGKLLLDIVPQIAYSDPTKPLKESGLPPYLQAATITLHGELTENFSYIDKLRKINDDLKNKKHFMPKKAMKKVTSYLSLSLEGHLFDKGVINKILDSLEECEINFNMVDMKIGRNTLEPTHLTIQMYSKHPEHLQEIVQKITIISESDECRVIVH